MMDFLGWNSLLFAAKWAFIGLIYLALFIVLIAVRREMSLRVKTPAASDSFTLGQLKLLQVGSDKKLRAGLLFPLKPETSLGAAPDNDLVLGDQFISNHHARMHWDGAVWWVEDLGSRNGTQVNQEACVPGVPRLLAGGALLSLGDMTFELIE